MIEPAAGMSTPPWEQMVTVGWIGRPHGLRGEVAVAPETDFVDERFAAGATVWIQGTRPDHTLVVATMRLQGGRPIVKFRGVDRLEDAEQLSGLELRVPEPSLQPLAVNAYYQHQLRGCEVETVAGERVGTVGRVEGGVSGSLLSVDGPRGEVLVPFTQAICVEIDVVGRRIRIEPPEGLLELNEVRHRHDLPAYGARRPGGRRRRPGH